MIVCTLELVIVINLAHVGPSRAGHASYRFVSRNPDAGRLGELQVALEEVFAPLRVDLVPLDRVDPLFQFRAIDGHRIAATDSTAADERELEFMRRAADLLPFQRQAEMDTFGVVTS